MKVFISADIEGTAGIAHWDEAESRHPDYAQFRALMTGEVVAACEGARAGGATQIVVKDAHDTGRNLLVDALPPYARIMRGWSGHPDAMMFGLDESFDAAIYTGYHAKAGSEANPLAHTTMTTISRVLLNGEVASEFTFNALCAKRYGVPSVFLSGDAEICREAAAFAPGLSTFATLEGFGRASLSVAPSHARASICQGVQAALEAAKGGMPLLEGPFELVLEFVNPTDAYRASWYPGVKPHGSRAIVFETEQIFELQRALRFLMQ